MGNEMRCGMKRNPEAVGREIRQARTIAVCSHINPDGDTLGSAAAMGLALKSLGKEVTLFCDGKIPDNLSFLPGADTFRRPDGTEGPFDLLLAVDISDQARLGRCESLLSRVKRTAQIDHHPTNPLFADVNSVDGDAPATCVLIREQLKELGVPLNRDLAICLYTGMSTDTGNFSFHSTNAETFEIMAELMRNDLPLSTLSRILFRERARPQVLLMGRAINSLRYYAEGRIAAMKLTARDFADCDALAEHADTIVNIGLETVGTDMALLGRDAEEGMVKFSLRAKSPQRIDDVAQSLGGGGHPQASGVTMPGPLDEALAQVVAAMMKKLDGNGAA